MFIKKLIPALIAWAFAGIMLVRYTTGAMQPEVYSDPIVGWATLGFTALIALLGATVLFWPSIRRV